MAVTTGGLVLLVGLGSKIGLPPVAILVTLPRAVELTVSMKLFVALAISEILVQTITPELVLAAAGTALTNTKPAGKLSVTEIPDAVDGPAFDTKIM